MPAGAFVRALTLALVLAGAAALSGEATRGTDAASLVPAAAAQECLSAREAVARGIAVPIRQVVNNIRAREGGRMLNWEYRCKNNRYRVKWETNSREIVLFIVDAGSGRIIRRK